MRKRRNARTAARRCFLAEENHLGPSPSQAFLRDLKSQDKDLELHWHSEGEKSRWVLYRVAKRATVPSEDFLVKEKEIAGPQGQYRPLGPWVLDWLRKEDKTHRGGTDPEYANRKYLADLTRKDKETEAEKQKQISDMAHNFARDVERQVNDGPYTRSLT